MIRVLQVPDTLQRSNGRMNVIMNIYRMIDRSQIQFDFVAKQTANADFSAEIKSMGGNVFFIPKDKKATFKNIYLLINEVLRNNKYSAIHYHAISPWGIGLYVARKENVTMRIIHSHSAQFSTGLIKSIRNKVFSRFITNQANVLIACSNEAGKNLFGNRSFMNIHNSIDTEKFAFKESKRRLIRNSMGVSEGTFLIGQVGRLSKEKNQAFSLRVIKELVKINSNVKFLIIGEGSDKDILISEVERLNLNNFVKFTGQLSNLNEVYSALDAVLLPSFYEGMPMAAIESQCAGTSIFMSSSITKEVNIGFSNYLALSEKLWVNELLKASKKHYNRSDAWKRAKQFSFDSSEQAIVWKKLYLNTGH